MPLPSGLDRIDLETVLCQLCSIAVEDDAGAGREPGVGNDEPERPRHLEDLAKVDLLRRVSELVARSWISDVAIFALGDVDEPVKQSAGNVGENVDEDGDPVDPRKIAHALLLSCQNLLLPNYVTGQ